MTESILGALTPVFGLIVLGYVLGRYHVLGDRAFEVLNRFVIAVTLPLLTFRSIAHMDPKNLAVPWMFVAVAVGSFATYAIGFGIERRLGRTSSEANIAALCACFSNTGFVGLPIALLALGPDSMAPVAVTMVIYSAIIFSLALIMSQMTSSSHAGVAKGMKLAGLAMLRSPVIVSAILGVAWSLLRLPLSGPADALAGTLAQATAPCALTAIGIFIALPRSAAAPAPIGRVVTLKLLVHPLITAIVIWLLPPIPQLWAKVAILMAAMPGGASSFTLAGKAGRWAMELSAWSVTLTTVLASVSLAGLLWLMI